VRTEPQRISGEALRQSLRYTVLAWIPGAFWQGATGNTALTPLAKYLGANDLIFSLLIVGAPLLSALLQIPGSMVVERVGRRKWFFIWTVTPHRTLYMVIGLLPWFLPGGLSTALLMTAIVFLSMGLNNFGGQAWVNWMADLVPPRIRGKFFSRRSRMGIGVIACATVLVATILDLTQRSWMQELLAPISAWAGMPPLILLLSVVFIVAGAIGMIDILLFAKVSEPRMARQPREPLAARLSRPLKDQGFRRFVVYWSVWQSANSWCTWFWMPYFLDFLTSEKARAAAANAPLWWGEYLFMTAAIVLPVGFQIGQFLGYPMWGRAVDRFGRKPVFFVSSTIHTLTWASWIFLSPAMLPWMLPIQILGGIIGGGCDIAVFNMMLGYNRKGGPGYQAVGTVVFSIAGAVTAIIAGTVATALADFQWTFAPGTRWEHTFNRYAVLIVVGMVIKYTADLVFLRRVQDVDSKPAGHALRFVLNNLHGTLNSLIFVPVRSGVEVTGRGVRATVKGVRRRL
jgi:MFS family permease